MNPGDTCPTCERRVPHPRKESSPKETKQLNLGHAPADYVDEMKERVDSLSKRWGLYKQPFFRLKALDLAVELAGAVTEETAQAVARERPWAA